jgi:hypothetical protein
MTRAQISEFLKKSMEWSFLLVPTLNFSALDCKKNISSTVHHHPIKKTSQKNTIKQKSMEKMETVKNTTNIVRRVCLTWSLSNKAGTPEQNMGHILFKKSLKISWSCHFITFYSSSPNYRI